MAELDDPHIPLTPSTTTSFLRRPGVGLMAIVIAGLSPGPMITDLSAQKSLSAAGLMRAERPVRTRYAGDEGSKRSLESGAARPLALAAADFDEDGVADLVSGYAGGVGGIITLHRGNLDSIFPNTPAAKRRRATGGFSDSPFLGAARLFAAPAAPDFLQAGDFDADGHSDVLLAARGGAALLLRGDGKGGLRRAERLELRGGVTAMGIGDIKGRDGLPDVVIGITHPTGSQALVFGGRKGAMKSQPEAFDLPSKATSLALGDIDDDHAPDLAVAAGSELVVIHPLAATRSVERRSLPFTIGSLAAGDFTGDGGNDLALISQDGEVHVLTNTARAAGNAVAVAGVAGWASEVVAQGFGAGPMRMVRARVANRPTDDLLLIDSSNQLHILSRPRSAPASARSLDLAPDWNRDISEAAAVLPMRLNIDARDDLVMLRAGQSAPLVAVTQVGTHFVVTNTNDSGAGSLRQAILNANTSDGDALITFAIPGPGPHTITPLTPLPPADVSEPVPPDLGTVIVDGTSQPGFAGTPVIELSGAVVGTSGDGLSIGSTGSVVRGLVINRFAAGIRFFDGFFGVMDGFVEGNYIGTDVSGTADLGNSTGVAAHSVSGGVVNGVTIGGTVAEARNVISGNGRGINSAAGNSVQGNFIGTDVTGTVALGNALQGVLLVLGQGGVIGGTAPGARNVISANHDDGILMDTETLEAFPISNNYIGTDVSGERALGNSGDGIEVRGIFTGATISGNVIAANGGHGVSVSSALPVVSVLDNRIGTNSAGTNALGNVRSGIVFSGQAVTGNVISGNGEHGLVVFGEFSGQNIVQDNRIGTDITGTAALGNLGDGVQVLGFPTTIGATESGPGNIIAFNSGAGVAVLNNVGQAAIVSNAIFSNGGLGIDLGDDGVTPNDACDADTGPSELQNFPVLTAVEGSASSTTIQGQLNSAPTTAYQLQFFASAAADPSGFGEGARLLGSAVVTTDSACNASFTVTLPGATPAFNFVTATATDPLMRTSEFSNAVAFVPATPQEATRLLIGQVRSLVAQGELNRVLGLVLEAKLRLAIFLMDRGHFRAAAQHLGGFNRLVAVFVRTGRLAPVHGQTLTDTANAIIALIVP